MCRELKEMLAPEIIEFEKRLAEQKAELAEQEAELAEQRAELADKDAEIRKLKEMLARAGIQA